MIKATPAWTLQLTPPWMSTKTVEMAVTAVMVVRVTRGP